MTGGLVRARALRRAVLVSAVVVLALLPAAARAQSAPSIVLRPSSQVVGGDVSVVGRDSPLVCIDPVARVEVTLAGEVVAEAPVGLDGDFDVSFSVPDVSAGDHTVTASCRLLRVGPPVASASAVLEVRRAGPMADEVSPGEAAGDIAPSDAPDVAPTAGVVATSPAGTSRPPGDVAFPRGAGTTTAPRGASESRVSAGVSGRAADGSTDPFATGRRDDVPEPIRRPVGRRGAPRVDAAVAPWQVGSSIPLLTEATVTVEGLLAAVLVTAVFALLVGFPNVLVNGAFRSNYDAITAGLRRRLPRLHAAGDALTERVPIAPLVLVAVAGAAAATFLDPTAAFDRRSGAVVTGLAIVIGGTCWWAWRPARRRSVGLGNVGRYRAYPVALGLVVGCVLLSRALDFQPGYLYGLLFAYDLRGQWTTRDDGLATLAGFSTVLAMGLAGWALLPVTHALADGGAWWGIVADTVAVGVTVVGVEAVVLGMLPFTFAPGRGLWDWRRSAFLALYAAGLIAFVALLSGQDRDLLVGSGDVGAAAAVAFLAYGAASVGFWDWWRRRRAREEALARDVADDVVPDRVDA